MTLNQHNIITHHQFYNEGWDSAASRWDLNNPKLLEPETSYTGEKREAFIDGFRDAQDSFLLDSKTKP